MSSTTQNIDEGEPGTAPVPGKWYNFVLGPSFKDSHGSRRFCTLRYEFKPASVNKTRPGSLYKSEDNRVRVEFQNNQHGKPRVAFEGVAEEFREKEAVLFFDGDTFRLEQLSRVVKRLRHIRLPGEPTASSAASFSAGMAAEAYSLPIGVESKILASEKDTLQHVHVEPVNPEGGEPGDLDAFLPSQLELSTMSPDSENRDFEEEPLDILNEDDNHSGSTKVELAPEKEFNTGIDINIPYAIEMDDEIANIDDVDDDIEMGCNAAEALRAQVNAEDNKRTSSSSSSSSSSESRSNESGSSSSSISSGSGDSEASDAPPSAKLDLERRTSDRLT